MNKQWYKIKEVLLKTGIQCTNPGCNKPAKHIITMRHKTSPSNIFYGKRCDIHVSRNIRTYEKGYSIKLGCVYSKDAI